MIKDRAWRPVGLLKGEWLWLIGAIFFGGVLAPTLFMIGLMQTSAASTSLLLNLESVLTAVLAWVFFKEHTDRRMVVGMLCIVAGGIVLSLNEHLTSQGWLGSLSIAAACFCWAIDNNLTRKISTGVAAIFMLIGVWIHLMERHEHPHTHMTEEGEITHSHPHYPDVHHRHRHD